MRVSVVVFLCGCSRGKEEEAANTETEIDIGNIDDVETGIKNMSEWEGTWLSFTAYCNDEKWQMPGRKLRILLI